MFAAEMDWPACGRASWIRGSKGCREPRSASIESAAAMSAARARRPAPAHRERRDGGGRLRAVDEGEPFLRFERHGLEPGGTEGVPAGERGGAVAGGRLSFADQHQREMRQRSQVAARADRAPARHLRVHAAVEQVDQAFERDAADAGESFGEHVGAQRHRRAHRANGERLADAGRVAAEQIELERAERAARNGGVGQRAEAGVDPVDRRRRPRPCDRRRPVPRRRARRRPARARPRRLRPRSRRGRRASASGRRAESSKKVEYCSYEHRGARRAVGRRGQRARSSICSRRIFRSSPGTRAATTPATRSTPTGGSSCCACCRRGFCTTAFPA